MAPPPIDIAAIREALLADNLFIAGIQRILNGACSVHGTPLVRLESGKLKCTTADCTTWSGK